MAKFFAVLQGVAIGALIFLLAVFVLAAISASTDTVAVQNKVIQGVRTSDIQYPGKWDPDDPRGIDTWGDCVVLAAAILRHGRLSEDMFDTLVYAQPRRPHPCNILAEVFSGRAAPNSTTLESYNRYWWGSAVIARTVLGRTGLSIKQYKSLLLLLSWYSLLVFVLAFLRSYGVASLVFLPFFMSIGLGYSLPIMGQGIAHAPEFIIALLLLSAYGLAKVQDLSLRSRAIFYSLLGSVCVYFDDLDSGLVLIEMLLCCQLAAPYAAQLLNVSRSFDKGYASPCSTALAREIVTNSAFVLIGGTSAILLHILGYSVSSHTNFVSAASSWTAELWRRESGSLGEAGLPDAHPSLYLLLVALEYGREYPFHGLLNQGLGDVFYFFGFTAWLIAMQLCWRLQARGFSALTIAIGFVMSAALVPAWFLVLEQHTIVHAWMTARLIPLFCGLGMSLAVLYIACIGRE